MADLRSLTLEERGESLRRAGLIRPILELDDGDAEGLTGDWLDQLGPTLRVRDKPGTCHPGEYFHRGAGARQCWS